MPPPPAAPLLLLPPLLLLSTFALLLAAVVSSSSSSSTPAFLLVGPHGQHRRRTTPPSPPSNTPWGASTRTSTSTSTSLAASSSTNPQEGGEDPPRADGSRPPPPEAPWFVDGARFGCTGCGKCCRVRGDVWLSPSEAETAAAHVGLSVEELADVYGQDWLQDGWLRLKSRHFPDGGEACVFLDDANQCSIYEARPLQCRTYPWWPRVMRSRDSWLNESVVPDDFLQGPHWNDLDGGCEGIEAPEAPKVEFSVIRHNLLLQMGYNRAVPSDLKA